MTRTDRCSYGIQDWELMEDRCVARRLLNPKLILLPQHFAKEVRTDETHHSSQILERFYLKYGQLDVSLTNIKSMALGLGGDGDMQPYCGD